MGFQHFITLMTLLYSLLHFLGERKIRACAAEAQAVHGETSSLHHSADKDDLPASTEWHRDHGCPSRSDKATKQQLLTP